VDAVKRLHSALRDQCIARARVVLAGLLGAGAPGFGCSQRELPEIVWEGEHVAYATDEPLDQLCAGTLPKLDAAAGHLSALLGGEDEITYYWVPGRVGDFCSTDGAVGCVGNDGTFSEYPTHQHEVAHAVGANRAHPALDEGIAEMFGDDWEAFSPLAGDFREMWASAHDGRILSGYYPLAGYLASYLVERFGLSTILALERASDWDDSVEVSNQKFSEVLGVSLEEVFEDLAVEATPCEQTEYRDNSFECSQPAIVLSQESELVIDMSCAEPEVQGPRRGERWRTLLVEVDASATHEIGLTKVGGSAPGGLQMRRCGQTCSGYAGGDYRMDMAVASDDPPLAGFQRVECIPAGRYVLRFSVDETDEARFLLRLRPVAPRECPTG
jgi:hypothetical protein